jgi:hypothetical protein
MLPNVLSPARLLQAPGSVGEEVRDYNRLVIRSSDHLKRPRTGSPRAIVAVLCLVASVAIFAHHSVPSMDMPGMSSVETCVSVAAHVVEAPAAPAVVLFALAGAVVLVGFSLGRPLRPSPLARARAGPREFRIPLRC